MDIINHYSMLWGALIILALTAFFLLRRGFKAKNGLILLFLAAVLLAGWFVFRPQQASADQLTSFQAELGQGQNLLLELQSPY